MPCKDCKEKPAVAKGTGSRCRDCFRKWNTERAAKRRQRLRKQRAATNAELLKEGKRICERCLHLKGLTEFGTSLPGRKGKLNKICDHCLTRMYEKRDSWYSVLRARAYSINSVARQRLVRELVVPVSQVSLSRLPWVLKPQDLAKKIQRQKEECCYCHTQLTRRNFTVDHVLPLSRGGKHTLRNLAVCCGDCNHLKHKRTKKEFLLFLRDYLSRKFSIFNHGGKT